MPLVNVKVIENVFSDEQKRQMVERLTDAMVSVEGENMRGVTWVLVEEVKSGDWGIGGNALTTEHVKALAGRSADPAAHTSRGGGTQSVPTAYPPLQACGRGRTIMPSG